MNELERTLLEYRPTIEYETEIRNEVERRLFVDPDRAEKADIPYEHNKTPVLQELEMYSPITVMPLYQGLKKDLEALLEIKETILESEKEKDSIPNIDKEPILNDEKENERNPIFGVDHDDISGGIDREIVDVIVVIEEQIKFIEDQIEYFYDININDIDIDKYTESERDRIDAIKETERKELSSIVDFEFSNVENLYIESLINDRHSDVNSKDDYIQKLLHDRINMGSANVDYASIADEVKIAYLLESEIIQIRSAIYSVNDSYYYTMNDAMLGETQQGLEFLVDNSGQLYAIKELSALEFSREVRDTKSITENMIRYNDISFRYALFEHLKPVKDLRNRYKGGWLATKSTEGNQASVAFATTLKNGEGMIDSRWENTVVEMISSSQTLYKQLSFRMESLSKKKHHSLLYRFADIVSREFDFEYKERELKTFVRRFNIDSMR